MLSLFILRFLFRVAKIYKRFDIGKSSKDNINFCAYKHAIRYVCKSCVFASNRKLVYADKQKRTGFQPILSFVGVYGFEPQTLCL